ncbi:MAG: UvrD-helicase domain-containing protein [bacterium]|nr:UvrD-helicase domain-containing protein [bacterium]
MHHLLEGLNNEQRDAVVTTDGPLLVIAGAGSGKTRVLTRRLAYILMQRLAEPYQMLAVTFTNKAAGEMKARVNALMATDIAELQVSTFHSFCARLLRREAASAGYDSNFTILDQEDSISLIKNCIKDLRISDGQFPAKGQARKISDAKNQLISADQFAQQASGYFESRTAEIYKLYQRRLRECNGMDFDDLIFNSVWILKNNQEIGDRYRNRFKYLLVDEYQDTNRVQYLLLKSILGDHQNICVVGDEDQSIYGWRGADIRNILEFEKDFPGARIIKLEQNYRSTNTILKAASAVIENNQARKGKTLWAQAEDGEPIRLLMVDSAEDEAVRMVEQIDSDRGSRSLKEMVILYRTNAQSRPFEEQLRRKNIPYQIVGGISFYHRKEIKDLMAYLKLIANPKDDVAFERIINYPKRGLGDKTVSDIAALGSQQKQPMYEIARSAASYPDLAGKAKRIQPFVDLIEKFQARVETDPIDILAEDLVADLKLIEELRAEDAVVGEAKVENIEAFIEGAAEFARGRSEANLRDYLSEISLFSDTDQYKEIEEKITLMTIHAAKGLEYETVYLVGLEEGLFPLQRTIVEPMELEEERRLFYVAATRARKRLFLSTATTRFRFGEVQSIPSRFIKEIPEGLLEKRDFRARTMFQYGNGYQSQSTAQGKPFPSHQVGEDDLFGGRSAASASKAKGETYYEYEENETYRVGRIVAHPTFGRGKILAAEGYGDSLRLEIMFTGLGVKKIMAKYAKLRIVG